MKTILVTFCCTIILFCNAQLDKLPNAFDVSNQKYFSSWQMQTFGRFEDETTIQHQKEAKLKSIQITHTKKGKVTSTTEQLFNKDGHIIQSKNSNGYQQEIEYRNNKAVSFVKKKKDKTVTEYKANYENELLKEFTIANKGKLNSKTIRTYDNGHLIAKTVYKKNKITPIDSNAYTLNEDFSWKSMEIYRKNKLQKKYLFDCDAKGVDAKKDVLSCKYYSQNIDGSYTTFIRQTQDGKERLYEHRYSKDSLLQASFHFDEDEKLIYSAELKNGNTVEYKYYKNGQLTKLYIHILDENANLVQRKIYRYNKKGNTKLIYDYSYSYNIKNLLETSRNNLNKKPSKYNTTYTYTFYK